MIATNERNAVGRSAVKIAREDLLLIPAPTGTRTWFPVPHGDVVAETETRLNESGFEIRRAQYSVTGDRMRMFATLDLASTVAPGVSLAVGIRNSNDRAFPISFAVGNRVFVCDNLSFSADVVVTRKHTRFGALRFNQALSVAVQQIGEYRQTERERISLMQSHEISDDVANSLILQSFETGILGARSLAEVIAEYRAPRHAEFSPRTVWSLLNAYTETLKPRMARPGEYAAQTIRLQGLLCRDARYSLAT